MLQPGGKERDIRVQGLRFEEVRVDTHVHITIVVTKASDVRAITNEKKTCQQDLDQPSQCAEHISPNKHCAIPKRSNDQSLAWELGVKQGLKALHEMMSHVGFLWRCDEELHSRKATKRNIVDESVSDRGGKCYNVGSGEDMHLQDTIP